MPTGNELRLRQPRKNRSFNEKQRGFAVFYGQRSQAAAGNGAGIRKQWFLAVFSGILSLKRRCQWLAWGHPRSNPFLEGHGTRVWKTVTTIGRANPKIAGSRPGGVHARRRAWARFTRRQPPHARARALPETNPGSEWPQPDSTAPLPPIRNEPFVMEKRLG